MFVLTPEDELNIARYGIIKSGERRVVSQFILGTIYNYIRQTKSKMNLRISSLNYYVKNYCGQNLNGKKLFIFRGCGIGDQLITLGIIRGIKETFTRANIDFCVTPQQYNNLFKEQIDNYLYCSIIQEPLTLDKFKEYDYHLLLTDSCECNKEPDQPNLYDAIYNFCDLNNISNSYKTPVCPVNDERTIQGYEFIKNNLKDYNYKKTILYQLSSSTKIRSYHPDLGLELIKGLSEDFNVIVTVAKSDETNKDCENFLNYKFNESVVFYKGHSFLELIGLIRNVDLVICPDSSIGHVSNYLGIKTVSLWGSFDSNDRVKYYDYHLPFKNKTKKCKYSPCRMHEESGNSKGCIFGDDGWCKEMKIDPKEIITFVYNILK